jgi:hypothetical protein
MSSFITCTLHQNDKMNNDEIDKAFGSYGTENVCM